MQDFFYMDGKAFFVWGAYGITVLVLALGMALASRRTKKILREIEENLQTLPFNHADSVPAKLMKVSFAAWSR